MPRTRHALWTFVVGIGCAARPEVAPVAPPTFADLRECEDCEAQADGACGRWVTDGDHEGRTTARLDACGSVCCGP